MTTPDRLRFIGAPEHPHAARRIAEALPDFEVLAGPGTAMPEPEMALSIRLETDPSLVEGAYIIATDAAGPGGAGSGIVIRGGPVSGVIQGAERLRRESAGPGSIVSFLGRLASGPRSAAPASAYRALWTWDHSTDWLLDALGAQDTGAFNPYNRQPDDFLGDYERLVDFASRTGINAIVVYGLLRDSHGGVEAAQRLCRYAIERGVRILAGVGINAYGAMYWEGDQPFNLATWLREHPDLAARSDQTLGFSIPDYGELAFPRSDYLAVSCPSRPENVRFHEEGVSWLVETLEVGGVNFEAGDYGACACDVCERERGSAGRAQRISDQYARLFDTVARSSRSLDRWSVYEVYTDNLLDAATREAVAALPDGAIYQYTVNGSYWPQVRKAVADGTFGHLPHTENALRTHVGSQWNRQRHAWVGETFAEMARTVAQVGMKGLCIFGETSAYHPPNELDYLAFARFSWEPTLEWERFEREEVEPRLGGREAAARFVALLGLLGPGADEGRPADPGGLAAAWDEARATSRTLAGEVACRWLWLEERLARRLYQRSSAPDSSTILDLGHSGGSDSATSNDDHVGQAIAADDDGDGSAR